MKRRKRWKVLLLVCVGLVFLYWLKFHNSTSWRPEDRGDSKFLPAPEELTDAKEVIYQYYYDGSWDRRVRFVLAAYDEDTYSAKKTELQQEMSFADEGVPKGFTMEMKVDFPEPFVMDGFRIRFPYNPEDLYAVGYPNFWWLLGTNDEKHEIVWMDCYAASIDSIPEPMETWLRGKCKWNRLQWKRRFPWLTEIWF